MKTYNKLITEDFDFLLHHKHTIKDLIKALIAERKRDLNRKINPKNKEGYNQNLRAGIWTLDVMVSDLGQ